MKENILSPKNIAVVGVSKEAEKIGSVIFKNILEGGYKGKVFPVNPKYKKIGEYECYPSVLNIPEKVDLVCIVVPSQFVDSIADECIEKKVSSAVIISAGFKETGEEGKKLEEKVSEKLKEAGIRVIGPNCLGFINNSIQLNMTFARCNPPTGNIAFISQSGAFCTAILDMACKDNVGFSTVVSIGNKADISENELIEYFQKDKETEAIAIYLEEFTDGKDFVEIAQSASKPMVIIVPGSSEKAKQAIASHTGSLVSSYDTTLAAIEKGNLIKATDAEELFDIIKVISTKRFPADRKIGIVTNAGGPGIIATDYIERFNLEVASFEESTESKLKSFLPLAASIKNPVDILGDAKADRYKESISILLNDKGVDCVLVILTPQLITDIKGTAECIVELQKKTSKPIFSCFVGGKDVEEGNNILQTEGLYVSNNIEDTVRIISKLTDFNIKENTFTVRAVSDLKKRGMNREELSEELSTEVTVLGDELAIKIVKEFDIDTPEQIVTPNLEEAIEFAAKHFPVAIKATAKDLAHKTDFKGLFLDIRTVSEFQTKFEELSKNIESVTGTHSPNILIQEMIEPKAEFFIGASREGGIDIYDENGLGFGHLMAIGQGGIYTEVYKDIRNILVPETKKNIERVLGETKISKIIDGYRGKPALAKPELLELLDKVQSMLVTYPEIINIDINPVILTERRAVPVDIKIYIKD